MADIKRNQESKIKELLRQFPVIVILGARQAGKTVLAKKIANDWLFLDLERPSDYDRLMSDIEFFFEQQTTHVVFDEAQMSPELFQVLRSVVDSNRSQKGRFILTGSSNPDLLDHVSETLAGRASIIELGTLKANEYYQKSLSPFYQLFTEKLNKANLPEGKAPLSNEQMQFIWLKGGYPEPVLNTDFSFYYNWMDNYHRTYINRDIARLFPRLNKVAYRRFITMLGKLSGTIINKRGLAHTVEVSEPTIKEYLDIAEGTFIWRQLPSFEKNIKKRILKMPKGYLRDTGLLHYLLNIRDLQSLYSDPIVGYSFEAYVIEELLKGLEATSCTHWEAYYYRTKGGAEIDLILDGPFGTLPIEIKYSSTVYRKQLIALSDFIEEHQLPFGIVFNQSQEIEWLTRKIIQIPIGWL